MVKPNRAPCPGRSTSSAALPGWRGSTGIWRRQSRGGSGTSGSRGTSEELVENGLFFLLTRNNAKDRVGAEPAEENAGEAGVQATL